MKDIFVTALIIAAAIVGLLAVAHLTKSMDVRMIQLL
jgi:archaellum component FlaG (FlaF/FlaG flagellin family)